MSDQRLPERFPIFPLPNVVLFPGVVLPLHVFERRYREMTRDALSGDGVIGMVLLVGEEEEPDRPPVYPVGCLGRIVRWRRTEDGRFLIVLRGLRRFRIVDEEADRRSYRTVRARILPEAEAGSLGREESRALELERSRIVSGVLEIARRSGHPSVETLEGQLHGSDALEIVNSVAFALDIPPIEKQSVLEQDEPVGRARALRAVVDFRRAEVRALPGVRSIN